MCVGLTVVETHQGTLLLCSALTFTISEHLCCNHSGFCPGLEFVAFGSGQIYWVSSKVFPLMNLGLCLDTEQQLVVFNCFWYICVAYLISRNQSVDELDLKSPCTYVFYFFIYVNIILIKASRDIIGKQNILYTAGLACFHSPIQWWCCWILGRLMCKVILAAASSSSSSSSGSWKKYLGGQHCIYLWLLQEVVAVRRMELVCTPWR